MLDQKLATAFQATLEEPRRHQRDRHHFRRSHGALVIIAMPDGGEILYTKAVNGDNLFNRTAQIPRHLSLHNPSIVGAVLCFRVATRVILDHIIAVKIPRHY